MYYLLYYMYYLLTFLTHGWHVRCHSSSLCGGCYATFITKTHVFTRLFISCPVQWHLCILILLTVLFVLTPLVFQVQPPRSIDISIFSTHFFGKKKQFDNVCGNNEATAWQFLWVFYSLFFRWRTLTKMARLSKKSLWSPRSTWLSFVVSATSMENTPWPLTFPIVS